MTTTTNERLERAERMAAAVRGYRLVGGGTVDARVWTGGGRVRVYLSSSGRELGWIGQSPDGSVSVRESRLGPDHYDITALVEAA